MGISRGVGDVAMTPSGVIVPFAGSNAPSGWLLCAGQAISRTQYAGLFLTISTTYGVGDGSTTFNLPDLRGRTIAGLDNMGGSAASRLTAGVSGINATTLGAAGGDERVHQHSHANTATFSGTAAAHTHTQDAHNHGQNAHAHGVYDPSHAHGMWTKGGAGGFGWEYPARALYGGDSAYTIWNANTGIGIYGETASNIANTATNQNTTITPAGTVAMTNANAGSGTAQNIPPTIVLNYIIRI